MKSKQSSSDDDVSFKLIPAKLKEVTNTNANVKNKFFIIK
jgi:hypothetical protein